MKSHACSVAHYCICSVVATEPNYKCPIHGERGWPLRCQLCGRFMKHQTQRELSFENSTH